MQKYLPDTEATEQFGAELYHSLPSKCVVFLHGDLGAGKTTLVRGYFRAAGFTGTVKSPTYNLVEEYHIAGQKIYHFDLYRITDPEELEWIGIDDYFNQDSVCFVEWPDKGEGVLPKPDTVITLTIKDAGRMAKICDGLSK
jgi:tRNA threonylcarbamoyladenosine biosynthesis protein TsaE